MDNNKKFKRIGNFKNSKSIIEWECLIDGHRWVTSPGNILNGSKSGCPICKYKNEKRIKELILKKYIN